jgi:hypothetical protein
MAAFSKANFKTNRVLKLALLKKIKATLKIQVLYEVLIRTGSCFVINLYL